MTRASTILLALAASRSASSSDSVVWNAIALYLLGRMEDEARLEEEAEERRRKRRERRRERERARLLAPKQTPWQHFYHSKDDTTFLYITGMTYETFARLLNTLFPPDAARIGRPSVLDKKARLGLLLLYLGGRVNTRGLSAIFGCVSEAVISRHIGAMLDLVIKVLSAAPEAEIIFPCFDDLDMLVARVQSREPRACDAVGFIETFNFGHNMCDPAVHVKYPAENYPKTTLAFASDGKVAYSKFGSLADSDLRSLGRRLQPYKLSVGPQFAHSDFRSEGDRPIFLVPLTPEAERAFRIADRLECIDEAKACEPIKRICSWGMRSLVATVPRLSYTFKDCVTRDKVIRAALLIHNFRTHYVDINRLKAIFEPEYVSTITEPCHDRIQTFFASYLKNISIEEEVEVDKE